MSGALARLVADTCVAQIVILGEEEHHGSGRAIQVKTAIVRELVQRCGFTHVAFESQIYDFVDLQERYAAGTATREHLYDAIGGLWSMTSQMDPLVELLHRKALTGQLQISGIDVQTGGAMGYYTQARLPARLSEVLPEARRQLCYATIGRLTGWTFEKAHPKDRHFDESVLGCAKEIETLASGYAARDPVQYRLAYNFRSSLELSQTNQSNSANDRDRLMYENLAWTISRLPRKTKTIVWTASVHGLRTSLNGRESMASHAGRDMKTRIKSIAIVATSGTYGGPGRRPSGIAIADAESLEGHFAPVPGTEQTYVDGDALKRCGKRKSRLLGYDEYVNEDWSELLDGVLVLASDTPPDFIRPPKPMQTSVGLP